MLTYHITTFGCQMNISDSERIASVLSDLGWSPAPVKEEADLVIFNTCSIKQKAEDKVYGHVKGIEARKKINPQLRFLVTGCMVRESGVHKRYEAHAKYPSRDGLFQIMDTLDCAMRIEDTVKLPEFLADMYGTTFDPTTAPKSSYLDIHPRYKDSYKAFVPIMTGCNKFCTYCIVPFTRKRELSRGVEEILEETRQLVDRGVVEITLLGQTVNSYRGDIPVRQRRVANGFVDLLMRLQEIDGLERIYYTSPHPRDMKDELIEAHVELSKLQPYIHLPVQSGDNDCLRRMNRNYTREWYMEIIHKIRAARPDIAISTDIIVGFDGETEKEFHNTIALYQEAAFDFAYVSQYSVRKGTFAATNMGDSVPAEEKRRRWHQLNELMKTIALQNNQAYEGRTVRVLVDKHQEGTLEGKSDTGKTVHMAGTPEQVGTFVQVQIERGREWLLLGTQV